MMAHHQSLMMALTPKRLFSLSLCNFISLLRPYTFFSRSPLVFKTLFEQRELRKPDTAREVCVGMAAQIAVYCLFSSLQIFRLCLSF